MGTSNDDQARIAELERQMRDVSRRLTAVEDATGPVMTAPGPWQGHARPGQWAGPPEPGGAGPGHPGDEMAGETTVRYWGAGQFGQYRLGLGQRMTLGQVRSVPPDAIAPVFAGLASPARIALLYALIDGPRTSQQLREVLDAPSVGQLYHHLRELLAAGLVVQPARSRYEIPPSKVVAVCVGILVANQLMSASHQAPPPILPEEGDPRPALDEPLSPSSRPGVSPDCA